MKKTSYTGKAKEELGKSLRAKREEFRKLKFSTAGSKNRNVKAGVNLRKEIARILTAMHAK